MNQHDPYGVQQSEIISSPMNRNMNERMSMQQIGYNNNMMSQDNYNSNMQNNFMSRNPQMYMSTRGPITNRTMNTFGVNEISRTFDNQIDLQKDPSKQIRTKSKKNINNKKTPMNKSRSKKTQSMIK